MSVLDNFAYSASVVDGNAEVREKREAYEAKKDIFTEAAYSAAFYNALAAQYALIPGPGMFFAAQAINADIKDFAVNGFKETSQAVALASNIFVLGTNGMMLVGGGGELAIAKFTYDEVASFVGALLATESIALDATAINEYVRTAASDLGIGFDSDGHIDVASPASGTFTVDNKFESGTLDVGPGVLSGSSFTYEVPILNASGQVTGFSVLVPSDIDETDPLHSVISFANGSVLVTGAEGLPTSVTGVDPIGRWTVPDANGNPVSLAQYSDDTFGQISTNVEGQILVSMANVNTAIPDQSNNVTAFLNTASQTAVEYSGTGGGINLSNSQIAISAGSQAVIAGGDNIISAGPNADLELAGQSIGDIISAAAGTTVVVDNGTQCVISNASTITAGNNTDITVQGNNTVVSAGNNSTVDISNNSNNDVVTMGAAGLVSVADGDHGTVVNASEGSISFGDSSTGNTVNGGNNHLELGSDVSIAISGSANSSTVGSQDVISDQGTNETLDVRGINSSIAVDGGNIQLENGSTANLNGAEDVVSGGGVSAGDSYELGDANNVAISASANFLSAQGDSVSISISGTSDTVLVSGAGDKVTITGNNDHTIVDGDNDKVNVTNSFDLTYSYGNGETTESRGFADTTVSRGAGDTTISYGDYDNTGSAGDADRTISVGNYDTTISHGDSEDTESLAFGDNTQSYGANDTTMSHGIDDTTFGYGYGDNSESLGDHDNTVSVGDRDYTVGAGDYDTTISRGNSDDTESLAFGDNTQAYGTNDTTMSHGVDDTTMSYADADNTQALGGYDNTLSYGDHDYTAAGGDYDTTISHGDNEQTQSLQVADNTQAFGDNDITTSYGVHDNTQSWGDGDTSESHGDWDTSISYGASDTTKSTGFGDNTVSYGVGDNTQSLGDNDTDISTNNYDTTVSYGNGDNTDSFGVGDDTVSYGSGDNTQSIGDGDYTVSTGTYDTTLSNGNWENTESLGYADNTQAFGSNDTTLSYGASDTTFSYGYGDNTQSLGDGAYTMQQSDSTTDISTPVDPIYSPSDPAAPVDPYYNPDNYDPFPYDPNDFPEFGDDDDFGGFGLAGDANTVAAAVGQDIGPVAGYEIAHGNIHAGLAAEAALHQANEIASATLASSGEGVAILESGKWEQKTVTWSLATSQDALQFPLSSYMGGDYELAVQGAFDSWAAAAPGMTFVEVQDSTESDIRIGFSSFDTANSGVIGYTTFQTEAGVMRAGAVIRLEDPLQDTLIIGTDIGSATYAGTDASLSQVLLHEIGHALGFADNADANSVMYYALGANNRTLDATDIAGAGDLYSAGNAASSITDLGQLTQAMASFAPASAVNQIGMLAANDPTLSAPLLATAH